MRPCFAMSLSKDLFPLGERSASRRFDWASLGSRWTVFDFFTFISGLVKFDDVGADNQANFPNPLVDQTFQQIAGWALFADPPLTINLLGQS